MKKIRAQVWSVLLVCAMLLNVSAVGAFAEESQPVEVTGTMQATDGADDGQSLPTTGEQEVLAGDADAGAQEKTIRESSVLDMANGSVVIGRDTYSQGDSEEIPIPVDGLVIGGTSDKYTITVDPGQGETAAFSISGLSLTASSDSSLIDIKSGSATITLTGENTLTGAGGNFSAPLRISDGQSLSVAGDGSLSIVNGTSDVAAHGAAIGGSAGEDGGSITIKSGTVRVEQYGPGAGIGGGGPVEPTGGTGDSGDITIAGGNVNVSVWSVDNYGGGCGIGPGINYYTTPAVDRDGIANTITISGGEVTVVSEDLKNHGSGAAIGTGRIGSATENSLIHITGNTKVNASLCGSSAAIGGASVDAAMAGTVPEGKSKILIDGDAQVEAQTIYNPGSLYCGAAIGLGANGFVSPWQIEIGGNATVNANGGEVGAGIGSAFMSNDALSTLDIMIGGTANVSAAGKDYAAGIGTSLSLSDSSGFVTITIQDQATVNAVGGYGAAAIGSGDGIRVNNSGNITITGSANVTATGGAGASGIGAGASGDVAGTTTITAGTTVVAYADGSKFAIDMDTTGNGKVNVTDTVLNGRFAEGEVTPTDSSAEDTESPINLLKDGVVDSKLTIPADYRAFAVTASDGEAVVRIQSGKNLGRYAYYTDDSNAKQINYPLYENVENGSNVMLTKDELRWMPIVELTPADITIYMGGDGYNGVVDEDGADIGSENGLPEAGFYIALPDDLDAQLKEALGADPQTALDLSPYLSFTNGDKVWTIERYDGENTSIVNGKYIYRLGAGDGQEPVRMQFVDADGTIHVSDQFELVNALYNRYDMGIYPGAVDQNTVYAVIDTEKVEQDGGDAGKISYTTYAAVTHTGTLTIRGVTKAGSTTEVVSGVTQPVSSVTAVLPKDTVYTVNDSDVKVVDGRPSLLVDEIASTDNSASGSDYRGVLVDKAVKLVGEGFQNVATQAKYLDLVDAANGNTWIQTDSKVTIYWPYPQGTDANTKFRLVHFDGLDREMTADEVVDAINKNEPVVVKDLVTDQYGIRFETDSFSPFVLVWDNTQTTTVTEEDDHPDIAEAIANGTWGQPTPTPAPAVVPQTGDNMPVMLLVILAVVAAGAIIVLVVVRKRNRH